MAAAEALQFPDPVKLKQSVGLSSFGAHPISHSLLADSRGRPHVPISPSTCQIRASRFDALPKRSFNSCRIQSQGYQHAKARLMHAGGCAPAFMHIVFLGFGGGGASMMHTIFFDVERGRAPDLTRCTVFQLDFILNQCAPTAVHEDFNILVRVSVLVAGGDVGCTRISCAPTGGGCNHAPAETPACLTRADSATNGWLVYTSFRTCLTGQHCKHTNMATYNFAPVHHAELSDYKPVR